MKNTAKLIIIIFAMMAGFVLLMTFSGDGISVDALLYNNDKNAFIAALEEGNYRQAADYLSFYNCQDRDSAAAQWAEEMKNSGIVFESVKRKNLIMDDGITLCPVKAVLSDGSEISFRIVIQGGGLSVSNVNTDSAKQEEYRRVMTTYYPG